MCKENQQLVRGAEADVIRSAISLSSETRPLRGNVEFQVHPLAVSGEGTVPRHQERPVTVGISLCYALSNQTFRG